MDASAHVSDSLQATRRAPNRRHAHLARHLVEHPAPSVDPGGGVALAEGREALVTAALLEVVILD